MTATNEETPDGQVEGFEITTTPEQEKEMNNAILTETTDNRETVRDVFAEIHSIGPIVRLLPAHALFQQVPAVMFKTAEQLDDAVIELDLGWYFYATVLDIDGRAVTTGLPEELWDAYRSSYSPRDRQLFEATPNAALRLGDFLVISHGSYTPVSKTTVDGVDGFEVITLDERRRRERAERAGYADRHQEVRAMCPWWADNTSVEAVDEQGADLIYDFTIGPVSMSLGARHENGRVTYDDESMRPFVSLAKWEALEESDMVDLIGALMTALPLVRDAAAQEVQ